MRKKMNIRSLYLSDGIWQFLYEQNYPYSYSRNVSLHETFRELEQLVDQADCPTGSTSFTSCWNLYSLITYFKIRSVIEVGTYIGRSTLTMAYAIDDSSKEKGIIYTCDNSNDIQLPQKTTTEVIQYPKTSSNEMLKDLESKKVSQCDMAYIDGRLNARDASLLNK